MKSLNRRIISLALVLTLILSAAILSGCYFVRSGTNKQIQGTYLLTHYSGNEDYIARDGIALLIVIDGSGAGYYAYRDNDTEPFIAELRYTLEADEEEAGKYSYINIDFGDGETPHHMAINADLTSTKLNSREPKFKGNIFDGSLTVDYYIDVDFEKVDGATDLSYITKDFKDAKQFGFAEKYAEGTYESFGDRLYTAPNASSETEISAENPFVYFYIDIDLMMGQATVRYMLKSDEKAVLVTAPVSVSNNGEMKIKIGDVETVAFFAENRKDFYIPFETEVITEGEESTTVTVYIPFYCVGSLTAEEIEENVARITEEYMQSKLPEGDGTKE